MSVSCQFLPVCSVSGQRVPHQVLETNFPFFRPTPPLPPFLASPGDRGVLGARHDKFGWVGTAEVPGISCRREVGTPVGTPDLLSGNDHFPVLHYFKKEKLSSFSASSFCSSWVQCELSG